MRNILVHTSAVVALLLTANAHSVRADAEFVQAKTQMKEFAAEFKFNAKRYFRQVQENRPNENVEKTLGRQRKEGSVPQELRNSILGLEGQRSNGPQLGLV